MDIDTGDSMAIRNGEYIKQHTNPGLLKGIQDTLAEDVSRVKNLRVFTPDYQMLQSVIDEENLPLVIALIDIVLLHLGLPDGVDVYVSPLKDENDPEKAPWCYVIYFRLPPTITEVSLTYLSSCIALSPVRVLDVPACFGIDRESDRLYLVVNLAGRSYPHTITRHRLLSVYEAAPTMMNMFPLDTAGVTVKRKRSGPAPNGATHVMPTVQPRRRVKRRRRKK